MAGRSAEQHTRDPAREIVATRTFDAPRELVWAAWTDPRHVARWWGPRGFTNTISRMEVRPGGAFHLVMHGPDGTDYRNEWEYVEATPPERIVLDHLGGGHRFRLTATFEASGARTTVTMRMTFESAAERDRTVAAFRADDGLSQNIERLGEYLGASPSAAPAREVVVTRLLAAPRALVFEAWWRPEHLARWWGPRGFALETCDLDFRPGGAYRMSMRGPDGTEVPFHGVYRELVPQQRIVFSAVVGPGPGDWVLTTVSFADEGGGTRLTVRQTVPGNAAMGEGQEQGWTETLERLAEHLALPRAGATAPGASPAESP